MYSQHIFLFPFKWEVWQSDKKHFDLSLEERTPINNIKKAINSAYWDEVNFDFKVKDGYNSYNEFAYFYDYTRDALNIDFKGLDNYIQAFQYQYNKINTDSLYVINVKGHEYKLRLEEVLLSIYPNGVGIFTYYLKNDLYQNLDDVNKINDAGRRLYPWFLGTENHSLTDYVKNIYLPNHIELLNVETEQGGLIKEDFSSYNNFDYLSKAPFVLPQHISTLLGDKFTSIYDSPQKGQVCLKPLIDDRMFVMCYVFDQNNAQSLTKYNETSCEYAYSTSKEWYKYLFIEGWDLTCQNKNMLKSFNDASTYSRWADYNALYGVTRYSFMVIGKEVNFTIHHFKKLYFHLVFLSLLQRSYIINFGMEVARISEKLNSNSSPTSKEKKEVNKLYLLYIKFVNRVFFREVTAQEQAIEFYDRLQAQMRISEHVKDLDNEIQELNNYVLNQQQSTLNLIAGRFLPATFVAGIIGMSVIPNDWQGVNNTIIGLIIILISLFFGNTIIKIFKNLKT